MRKTLDWTVGYGASADCAPADMVKANVPGDANLDFAAANGLNNWQFGVNYKRFRDFEDGYWLYEAALPKLKLAPGEGLFFVAEGIDYGYRIKVDGRTVLEGEGMFTRIEIPLKPEDETLKIWIAPPPKDKLGEAGTRSEAAQSCKPAVSYSWDFHPRVIPVGLWQDAYLEIRSANRLENATVDYELNADFTAANVTFAAEVTGRGTASLTIFDAVGKPVLRLANGESGVLETPSLWWCNGYGEPALYSWEAVLSANGAEFDRKTGKLGFRKIELTMNEGAWNSQNEFPATRDPAPITITLNGVNIFAKGSNWVAPEVFTGTITQETYLPLIELARNAHFNILRCWGGAIVNKDAFYELCDERGIMVWQEFPLACNNYRGTPEYLRTLEREARSVIARLKPHPCLALWCGGNELFNSWSGMTDQSKALRLLNKLCYELDGERPFLATSPLYGMGHGPYAFRRCDGAEVYEFLPRCKRTAYPEFGVPSISNLAVCASAANAEDLFPLERNETTAAHHAFGAYIEGDTSWANTDVLRDYFGEAASLNELIAQSQWLQGEGLKFVFEEARRQKPYCSMALNWCFNEPWPTLANNSIINYPAVPKSSFKDVADACRNALISAKITKFVWAGGETFSAEIWLLNDGRSAVEGGEAEIYIEIDCKRYGSKTWAYDAAPANVNLKGITITLQLPRLTLQTGKRIEMALVIEAGALSSRYRLLYGEL